MMSIEEAINLTWDREKPPPTRDQAAWIAWERLEEFSKLFVTQMIKSEVDEYRNFTEAYMVLVKGTNRCYWPENCQLTEEDAKLLLSGNFKAKFNRPPKRIKEGG